MNAFPQSQYRGLQVYFSGNDPRSCDLASIIQDNTKSLLQTNNDRKIKKASSNIYLLHRITSPAVLVECGFLSNPEEERKLNTPEHQKKIAAILAAVLAQYVCSGV